jgi:hypothetical protein
MRRTAICGATIAVCASALADAASAQQRRNPNVYYQRLPLNPGLRYVPPPVPRSMRMFDNRDGRQFGSGVTQQIIRGGNPVVRAGKYLFWPQVVQ